MLKNGTAAVICVRLGVIVAGASSTILVARALGVAGFGVYAAASAVSGLATYFGALGADQLYLRGTLEIDALKQQCRRVAALLLSIGIAMAVLVPMPSAARLPAGLMALVGAAELARLPWLLEPQRALDFTSRARRELFARISTYSVAPGAAALVFKSATAVAVSMAASAVAGALWSNRSLGSTVRPIKSCSLIRAGMPYALSGVLFTAYFQIDQIIVASLLPSADAGLYRAVFTFVRTGSAIAAALNNDILRPRLYRSSEADRATLERRGLFASGVLGAAIAVFGVLLIGPVLRVGFGESFAPAQLAGQIAILSMAPHFVNSFVANMLISRSRTRAVVAVQSILLLLNIILNLILVPRLGIVGAAWATVGTEGLALLVFGFLALTRWGCGSPESYLEPRASVAVSEHTALSEQEAA